MGERVGPADRLRSAALWVLNLSWFVPSTLAMTALYATVGSARVDGLTRAYCRAQLALLGNHYRHVVHPDALVERPMLFAANHVNHFDYITLYCATPHYKQGIELETHFRYPIYGRFMKLRGTIPVPEDRARRSQGLLAAVRAEVARGHSILAFPEGTRTLDGRVGPFRSGVFRVARELSLPIVPVAVTGMYEVLRKGSLLLRGGQDVTVWVEKPVPTEGSREDDLPAIASEVRAAIASRVDDHFDTHA